MLVKLIIAISILLFGFIIYFNFIFLEECAYAHSSNGYNYRWLSPLKHGDVVDIEYQEPPYTGNWKSYTDDIWETHCKVVDHNPDNLVEEHMKAFVYPETRFALLKFRFEDDTLLLSEDRDTFRLMYELERDYFKDMQN